MGIVTTSVWMFDGVEPSREEAAKTVGGIAGLENQTSASSQIAMGNNTPANTQSGKDGNRFETHLLQGAALIEQKMVPGNTPGVSRQKRLWRTGFKYPLIHEEVWIGTHGTEIRREYSVADHVLVKFPLGYKDELIHAWAEKHGFYIRHSLKTVPLKLVAIPDAGLDGAERIMTAFREDFPEAAQPQVALAERDFLVFPTLAPDDISFAQQWALENTGQTGGTPDADIDAPEAWNITTGSRDVLVAVIDTGVDRSHPDLEANMWTNPGEIPGNGIDDDGNGFVDDVYGWDFFSGDNNPMDEDSHGTHCAGIIGAVGNNRSGISGVCWQVSMVGIRFLGPGGGTTSDAIESIYYAASLGVDLTSNSWGGGGMSLLLQDAIEDAGAQNIAFVAAAGNDGTDNDLLPHYPSSFTTNSIISVASSTASDTRSGFSNFGRVSVDVAAPGTGIYSTVPGSMYHSMSGTSMAAPHVAGALALARSIAPLSSVQELKGKLMAAADPVDALSAASVTGGRLNVAKFMEQMAGPYPLLTVLAVNEMPGGNGDGIPNPGEHLEIEFRVTNRGTEPATDVVAMVASAGAESRFELIQDSVQVGTLLPGHTTVTNGSFVVLADADTPTPHAEELVITLQHGSPVQVLEQRFDLRVYTSSVVAGRVTDVEDGAGLAKAAVLLEGPSVVSVTADEDGGYTATVTDGVYQVSARAQGYLQSPAQEIQAPPGASDVDFALGRPKLRVEPGEVTAQMGRGESLQRELVMTNQGTAPLEWSLRARSVSPQTGSHTLAEVNPASANPPDREGPVVETANMLPEVTVPLNNLAGVTIGAVFTTLDRSVLLNDLRDRGAQVITLAPPLTAALLEGVDALLVDDTVQVLSAQDIQRMRAAIQDGMGLLCEADNLTSMAKMHALLADTGISPVSEVFRDLTLTDIVPHPITSGVTMLRELAVGATATLSGPAQPLVREPNGRVHAAVSQLGRGVVVFVGNEITDASNFAIGDGRRFANQIVDGLLEGPGWLAISPLAGTLEPGAVQVLSLTLDSGTLAAGTYAASLSVASNIPDEPALLVPVTLEVVDLPVLSVNVQEINFDEVFVAATASRDVILSNTGTAPLLVQPPQLSGGQAAWFQVSPPNELLIQPSGQATVRVTFSNQAPVGGYAAYLRLTSNDARNAVVDLPIVGRRVAAPFIQLNPEARTEKTLAQGQTTFHRFTLSNRGKGILRYHPEIVFPEGRPADWVEIEDAGNGMLAPGKSARLTLHFHARAHPASLYFAQLRVTSDDPIRSELIRELMLTTQSAPVLEAEGLSFDKTYVGESQSQILTLTNTGQTALVLRNVRGLNAAFRATFDGPVTLVTGGTVDIPVTFAPRKAGLVQSNLVFISNKPGPAFRVPVSGMGARHPDIRVTPARIIMSSVPGVPKTRLIHVRNRGGEDLEWSLQPLPGDAGWLGQMASSSSISPKGKGQVQVTFSSDQWPAGDYVTAVNIQSNDPNQPVTSVPVTLRVSSHALLQAAPLALDLGEVWKEHPVEVRFDLTNQGNLPLEIRQVTSNSKDLVIPWTAETTLAPGETLPLTGTLRASKLRPFKGFVTVKSNSRVKPSMRLPVTATVSEPPAISVEPEMLAETLAPNQVLSKDVTITNAGGALLQWQAEVIAAEDTLPGDEAPDLSWLQVDAESGTTEAGGVSPLGVKLDARGLAAGTYEARVHLASNAPDSPTLDVPVSMTVQAAAVLVADPGSVNLPETPVRGTAFQTVTLRNDGNLPLTLEDIISSEAVFEVSPALAYPHILAAGESLDVQVAFTPAVTQVYTGQLTVLSDVEGQGELVLPISGVGLPAPLLVLNPKAIVLTTRPGVPASQDITIENQGSAALDWEIEAGLVTGILSDLSGSVEPGESQVITLTSYSTPTTQPGASVHSITFRCNDPVQSVTGIPYTRIILVDPVLLVTPSIVDFETVYLPGSGQRQVTLRNVGNANLWVSSAVSSSNNLTVPQADFPLLLQPGSQHVLDLEYAPAEPEALAASVVFSTNNPITPELAVPVTGIAAYPPTLAVSPGRVDASVEEGRSFSARLELNNDGGSVLNWSANITPISARSWLSLSLASGSTLVNGVSYLDLQFNATSLPVSSRSATLTITSNALVNGTAAIPITLQVTPGEFNVSTTAIESATVKGAADPDSAFSIIPRVDANPAWTLASTVPWIYPSATSGMGAADITLQYSHTLAEGSHVGQVTVSAGSLTRVIQITRHVVKRQFSQLQTDRRHDRVLGMVKGAGGKPSFLVAMHPQTLAVQQVLPLPTDITSMDLSTDERTLYAISFAGRSISRVRLDDFTLDATKSIPMTNDVGNSYQVQAGREGRVYYTDATSNPALHDYDFEAGTDVDVFRLSGLQGIGSFVVSPDAGFIYARSQTGTGNTGTAFLAQIDCRSDLLTQTAASSATLAQDTAWHPVLLGANLDAVVTQENFFTIANLAGGVQGRLTQDRIYNASAYLDVLVTASQIVGADGSVRAELPVSTTVTAFSPDQSRLIYQDPDSDVQGFVETAYLPEIAVLPDIEPGSLQNPTLNALSWSGDPSVARYDLYLGVEESVVDSAVFGQAGVFRVSTSVTSYSIYPSQMVPGQTYYWRVDLRSANGTVSKGPVWSFRTAMAGVAPADLSGHSMPGDTELQERSLSISTSSPSDAWTLVSDAPWVTVGRGSGTGTTSVSIWLNPASLSSGTHHTTLRLLSGEDELTIPVRFDVMGPVNIVKMKADPVLPVVYALHRETVAPYLSWLLWMDPVTGTMQDGVMVGAAAVDFTPHAGDDIIYALVEDGRRMQRVSRQGSHGLLSSYDLSTPQVAVHAGSAGRLITFSAANSLQLRTSSTGAGIGNAVQVLGRGSLTVASGDGANVYAAVMQSGTTAGLVRYAVTGVGMSFVTATYFPGSLVSPLLISGNGAHLVFDGQVYTAPGLVQSAELGRAVHAVSPDGSRVVAADAVYSTGTPAELQFMLPFATNLAVVTADGLRLLIYSAATRTFQPLEMP